MKNNQKMNEKKQQKIAICGLDCGNCDIYNASNNPEIAHQLVKQFQGAWEDVKAEDFHCNGCRSNKTQCWTPDCWIRECCVNNKNLEYCYECQEFPCDRDMYSTDYDPKIKAFARCIKEDGVDQFIQYVLDNKERGMDVSSGKDYDNKTEKEVLSLLRTGPLNNK